MRLANTDGLKCFYCDRPLTLQSCTLDHIYPKSLIKTNGLRKYTVANSVLACRYCNSKKSDRVIDIEEFRKEMMGARYTPSKSFSTKKEKKKKTQKKKVQTIKVQKLPVMYAKNPVLFKEVIFVEKKPKKTLWQKFIYRLFHS